MPKKTILHFTYSLGRGGAETMLVRVLKELGEYNNIVVEMYGENSFKDELECDKYISMNYKTILLLPFAIVRLWKIVRNNNVDLVHTHLFWPTVIARIATPKNIPLVTTIHTSIANSVDYKHWHICAIDRLTSRIRKSIIVAVSKASLNEYLYFLKTPPLQSHLLHTFVDTEKFNIQNLQRRSNNKFLLVSVGALREGKGFESLIKNLSKKDFPNVELHIYGKGCLEEKLQKLIVEHDSPTILKGEVKNIQKLLPAYNLYISASAFEGFSLSILEAMAMNLPLLLSDIPSFKEQCNGTAIYFNLDDEIDFKEKLNACIANPERLKIISAQSRERVFQNFTLSHHISGLKKIYTEAFTLYKEQCNAKFTLTNKKFTKRYPLFQSEGKF